MGGKTYTIQSIGVLCYSNVYTFARKINLLYFYMSDVDYQKQGNYRCGRIRESVNKADNRFEWYPNRNRTKSTLHFPIT